MSGGLLRLCLTMRGFKRFKDGHIVYYYHDGKVSPKTADAACHDSDDSDSTSQTDHSSIQRTQNVNFSPIICHGLGFGKNYYIGLIDKLLTLGRPILTAPQLQCEQAGDRNLIARFAFPSSFLKDNSNKKQTRKFSKFSQPQDKSKKVCRCDLVARFNLPFKILKAAVQDEQTRKSSNVSQSMFRARRKSSQMESLVPPSRLNPTEIGTGTVWDSIQDLAVPPDDNIKVNCRNEEIAVKESYSSSIENIGNSSSRSDWNLPEIVEVEGSHQSSGVIIRFTERDREKFRYRKGSEKLQQWEDYEEWNEKRIDAELLLCSAKNLVDVFMPSMQKESSMQKELCKQKSQSERLMNNSRILNEQFVTL